MAAVHPECDRVERSYSKAVNGLSSSPPSTPPLEAAASVEFTVDNDAVHIHPTNNGFTPCAPSTSALWPSLAESTDDISTDGSIGNVYDSIEDISCASQNFESAAAAAAASFDTDIDSTYILFIPRTHSPIKFRLMALLLIVCKNVTTSANLRRLHTCQSLKTWNCRTMRSWIWRPSEKVPTAKMHNCSLKKSSVK